MAVGVQGFALELKRARGACSSRTDDGEEDPLDEVVGRLVAVDGEPCDDAIPSTEEGIGNTSACSEKETRLAGVAGERSPRLDFLKQLAELHCWSSAVNMSPGIAKETFFVVREVHSGVRCPTVLGVRTLNSACCPSSLLASSSAFSSAAALDTMPAETGTLSGTSQELCDAPRRKIVAGNVTFCFMSRRWATLAMP